MPLVCVIDVCVVAAGGHRRSAARLHGGAAAAAAGPGAGRAPRGAGGLQLRRAQQTQPRARLAARPATHHLRRDQGQGERRTHTTSLASCRTAAHHIYRDPRQGVRRTYTTSPAPCASCYPLSTPRPKSR